MPSGVVTTTRDWFVVRFVSVTVTPGRTAPVPSVTRPDNVAGADPPCANASSPVVVDMNRRATAHAATVEIEERVRTSAPPLERPQCSVESGEKRPEPPDFARSYRCAFVTVKRTGSGTWRGPTHSSQA